MSETPSVPPPDRPFSLTAIDHVVLRVADLARALDFYCRILGCSEERRLADLGLVQLRAGTAIIDLVPVDQALGREGGRGPGAEGRNVDHICLRLDRFDDDALTAYFAAQGIAVSAIATRYGAEGFGPSLYIRDPDGNTIELKASAG